MRAGSTRAIPLLSLTKPVQMPGSRWLGGDEHEVTSPVAVIVEIYVGGLAVAPIQHFHCSTSVAYGKAYPPDGGVPEFYTAPTGSGTLDVPIMQEFAPDRRHRIGGDRCSAMEHGRRQIRRRSLAGG